MIANAKLDDRREYGLTLFRPLMSPYISTAKKRRLLEPPQRFFQMMSAFFPLNFIQLTGFTYVRVGYLVSKDSLLVPLANKPFHRSIS